MKTTKLSIAIIHWMINIHTNEKENNPISVDASKLLCLMLCSCYLMIWWLGLSKWVRDEFINNACYSTLLCLQNSILIALEYKMSSWKRDGSDANKGVELIRTFPNSHRTFCECSFIQLLWQKRIAPPNIVGPVYILNNCSIPFVKYISS